MLLPAFAIMIINPIPELTNPVNYVRGLIVSFFVISLFMSIKSWLQVIPEDFISENPYLVVSPYRVYYTVCFPLA